MKGNLEVMMFGLLVVTEGGKACYDPSVVVGPSSEVQNSKDKTML